MRPELKALYQKILLDRAKSTLGFEKGPEAQHIIEAYNPVCGDQFKLFLDLDTDKVDHASYHGYGCAISKASTSLLIESIQGKNLDECRKLIDFFKQCMSGMATNPGEIYQALALSKEFPGRQQCAVLSWQAFENFIDGL
ncbi:MAG: SUF system NifU family Fe-S cluster assembly protein [Cyclobacteriaceae bacterium]|nr:SUF system NifU family Fe-S cluster assembly protein [Cyclobacteriaceae bacterium]